MGMKDAYNTSARVFDQVSKLTAPAMYEQLKAIGSKDIVVVKGDYDHIETLLDTMKVPYTLITPEGIAEHNGGNVMLVNCRTYGNGNAAKAAEQFVGDGGRLVTTDWAVSLLTRAFPGKLHKVADTIDDVVEIQCSTDLARKWIGMNYAQCSPKWWLETASHIYRIDPKASDVIPIITSEEMEGKYGQQNVAVGFPYGKGEVFHFISHLELQRTRQKSTHDKGGLKSFLEKMNASQTDDMDDASVAELEAAYSTLNTLAHLCVPQPMINSGGKSVMVGMGSGPKSVKLG